MTLKTPSFQNTSILVIGDVMLDQYWHGSTSRISPEAPVPVVHLANAETKPGGAGNVALNVAALGCQTTLIGLIGNDIYGKTLNKILKKQNIHAELTKIDKHPTITKTRVLSQNQQLLRLDKEVHFNKEQAQKLITHFASIVKHIDAVIISDYAKGVHFIIPQLIQLANEHHVPVFVDPKHQDFTLYRDASILTPNLKEFEAAVGSIRSEQDLVDKAQNIIKKCNLQALLVTRGEKGMTLITANTHVYHLPTQAREIFDVTGAGDTVISVLASCFASGSSLQESVQLANLAASITVNRLGAVAVTTEELSQAIHSGSSHNKIVNIKQLQQKLQHSRNNGERIVMTNGCFDIIHAGHVHYLQQAKQLGHRLIVAVNSDASVRRLKDKNRPIHALEARMAVLAGLECVDWVISFTEDTPENLIHKILPDVLVKGGDYTVDKIAGAKQVLANGGEVEILAFLPGFSTSKIVEKLQVS